MDVSCKSGAKSYRNLALEEFDRCVGIGTESYIISQRDDPLFFVLGRTSYPTPFYNAP